MKQIIKDILNIHGEMNVNLASDAARDVIAIEIIEKLKKKGFYTEYSKDELEKREAKKGWVCQTCGKSTFETEYDYLVHPKLHLGCALEEELKGKDIKEQYHEASSKLFKVGKRESVKYSSKGPEYDYRENPSIPYLPGKYTEEDIVDNKDIKYIYESTDGGKTIYRREFGSDKKELVKNWDKEMKDKDIKEQYHEASSRLFEETHALKK